MIWRNFKRNKMVWIAIVVCAIVGIACDENNDPNQKDPHA